MSWNSMENQEKRAKECETRLIEKIELLKKSQESYNIWNGFRTDNGYKESIEQLEIQLTDFQIKNVDLLI